MGQQMILYPSIAMFLLTAGMIVAMGLTRRRLVRSREVSIKYYQLFEGEDRQPERLRVLTRHVQNHFEIPPLFHAGVLMAYVSGQVGIASVVLAWAYVLLRCVHSWIHLGSNNVTWRFNVFACSFAVLALLWLLTLAGLLGGS